MKKVVSFANLDYLVMADGKIPSTVNTVGKIVMSTRTKTEKVLKFLVDLSVKHGEVRNELEQKLQGVLKDLIDKYGTEEEKIAGKLKEDSPNVEALKAEWEGIYSKTMQTEVEVDFSIEKDLFDKEKLSAEQLNAINTMFA
jgi:hypothetical protein